MLSDRPIVWASQLQTEIALSSTESEVTAGLSYALRSAIPMMRLINELKSHKFKVPQADPRVHCKVFEDNRVGQSKLLAFRRCAPALNISTSDYITFVTTSWSAEKSLSMLSLRTISSLISCLTKPQSIKVISWKGIDRSSWVGNS
jgi:hypothetical protein